MNSCDFARSFLKFTGKDHSKHTPRLQVDAVCRLTAPDKKVTEYVVTVPCMSENMYRPSGLIQEPTSHFAMFAGNDGTFTILKHHASAAHDVRQIRRVGERISTHDGKGETIGSVDVTLNPWKRARRLTIYKEIREAILNDHPINGITRYLDADGKTQIELEYPVKTCNIANAHEGWQIDTGPVIMPDPASTAQPAIERMTMAFLVYNAWSWADTALKVPSPVDGGGALTQQYSRLLRMEPVANELYAADQV